MNSQKGLLDNRRGNIRRPTRCPVKVECRKGAYGLGHNIAESLLDVSQAGARLTVKVPLAAGEEVELRLMGQGHLRPLRALGQVVRSELTEEEGHCICVRFHSMIPWAHMVQMM
jgi:hypothetical protein